MEKRNNGLTENQIKVLIDAINSIKKILADDENKIERLNQPEDVKELENKAVQFKELLASMYDKLKQNNIDINDVLDEK